VNITLTNTSNISGAEIVQCYLKSDYSEEIHPVQELIQFKRIPLNPNDEKEIPFEFILNEQLSSFGLSPGNYELQIGSSSKDIRIVYHFELK
jgi:beta-glucosidase